MSEELSVESFAAALSAPAPAAQPIADAAAEPEQFAEGEQPAAEGEAPIEQSNEADPDAPPEEGEQAEPALSDDSEVEWETSAGEKFKAPLKELKDGYMRHEDYSRKTQQLSEERKSAEAQARSQFADVETHATELSTLQQVQQRLTQFGQIDWRALEQADPVRFNTLKLQEMELQSVGARVAQSIQQRKATLTQQSEQAFQAQTANALQTLSKTIPGFGKSHIESMREYGIKEGFQPEELARISDPRLFLALHKAAQWEAMQAKKPALDQRAKAIPPKAMTRAQAPVIRSKAEEAVRVAKSGKDLDARGFANLLSSTRSRN